LEPKSIQTTQAGAGRQAHIRTGRHTYAQAGKYRYMYRQVQAGTGTGAGTGAGAGKHR
jgi:hypothetical protein